MSSSEASGVPVGAVLVDADCDLNDPLEIALSNLLIDEVYEPIPTPRGEKMALSAVEEVSTHITKG